MVWFPLCLNVLSLPPRLSVNKYHWHQQVEMVTGTFIDTDQPTSARKLTASSETCFGLKIVSREYSGIESRPTTTKPSYRPNGRPRFGPGA